MNTFDDLIPYVHVPFERAGKRLVKYGTPRPLPPMKHTYEGLDENSYRNIIPGDTVRSKRLNIPGIDRPGNWLLSCSRCGCQSHETGNCPYIEVEGHLEKRK